MVMAGGAAGSPDGGEGRFEGLGYYAASAKKAPA